jgi:hypothetical protein
LSLLLLLLLLLLLFHLVTLTDSASPCVVVVCSLQWFVVDDAVRQRDVALIQSLPALVRLYALCVSLLLLLLLLLLSSCRRC